MKRRVFMLAWIDSTWSARAKPSVDEGHVEIGTEFVNEIDADCKQRCTIKRTDDTDKKVRTLGASLDELHAHWADYNQRAGINWQFAECVIFPATDTEHFRKHWPFVTLFFCHKTPLI